MALAETAKLVAELRLDNQFSGPAGTIKRDLGGVEGALDKAGRRVGVFGTAIGTAMGVGLERAVSGGIRALVGGITTGVDSLRTLEAAEAQTAAAIESTNGVAGVSASQVRDLAEEYENLNAIMDDKVIQSAENVLLTFTNIRKDAFQPTLEAALNLNQRLADGSPESLQGSLTLVAKAINDPITGLTSLRRAGVQFSDEQRTRIKQLVEENDLYGAQQIVLAELNTQFGGAFEAAGRTGEGRTAALNDKIEDLQKALAGGLMPVIDRVQTRIIDALGSDAAIDGATRLGTAIASLFTDENLDKAEAGIRGVFDTLGSIDYGAIADGIGLVTAPARAAFDLFRGLPPEVQGVVIAGLAANRLSGGLLGSGIGALAKLALNGLKTIVAGNVTVVGANVTGGIPGAGRGLPVGGAPVAGGGLAAGIAGGAALTVGVVAAGIAVKTAIDFDTQRNQQQADLATQLKNMPTNTAQATADSISRVKLALAPEGLNPLEQILFDTNVKPVLERGLADLQQTQQQQAIAMQAGNLDAQRESAITRNSVINEFRTGRAEQRARASARAGEAARAASSDRAMLNTAHMQHDRLREQIRATAQVRDTARDRLNNLASRYSAIGGEQNAKLERIARKNFSPKIDVIAKVDTYVSVSSIQTAARTQAIARGDVSFSGFQPDV